MNAKPSKSLLNRSSLTIHLLTKNNAKTIKKAIQSILPCNHNITIADLGSTDGTVDACRSMGFSPIITSETNRSSIRNRLTDKSDTEWNFYLEPWEAVLQGYDFLKSVTTNAYISVVQNDTITKEVRFWKKGQKFDNPIFEKLDCRTNEESGVIVYSSGRSDYKDVLSSIELWKKSKPTQAAPYYYQALVLMAMGNYDEFLRCSEHYMHMATGESNMATTMNHYYYAMATILHKKGTAGSSHLQRNVC